MTAARRRHTLAIAKGILAARRTKLTLVRAVSDKRPLTAKQLARIRSLRKRLTDIEARAREEINARLSANVNTLAAQRAIFGSDIVRLSDNRSIETFTSLKNRCSNSTTVIPEVDPRYMVSDGDCIESELWLCEQVSTTLRQNSSHDDLMRTLDSCDRARNGKVKIRANMKRQAETAYLAAITTREQLMRLLSKSYRESPISDLSVGHVKNRSNYVRQWEDFAREAFHISPWRYCWDLDLAKHEQRREETYLLAYFTLCRLKYGNFNTAEQALSHVRQFHITHLDLVPPHMPRLRNRIRIGRRHALKTKSTRTRRPSFKPAQIRAVAEVLQRMVDDDDLHLDVRVAVAALWCVMCAGFQLLFRVGELARGAEFSPARHWSVAWLQPLCTLQHGQDACVPQPQRKVETEYTQEFLPVYYDSSNPANFVYAYKRKTALFAHSGRQDAFAIDMAGTSPTAEWVCGRLRAIMKAVFPSAAHGLDYTDHCLRRGGATCLCFMNIDPAIQEHAGGFSRNSASRPAYVAMVRQTLANAQARMHKQEYDII